MKPIMCALLLPFAWSAAHAQILPSSSTSGHIRATAGQPETDDQEADVNTGGAYQLSASATHSSADPGSNGSGNAQTSLVIALDQANFGISEQVSVGKTGIGDAVATAQEEAVEYFEVLGASPPSGYVTVDLGVIAHASLSSLINDPSSSPVSSNQGAILRVQDELGTQTLAAGSISLARPNDCLSCTYSGISSDGLFGSYISGVPFTSSYENTFYGGGTFMAVPNQIYRVDILDAASLLVGINSPNIGANAVMSIGNVTLAVDGNVPGASEYSIAISSAVPENADWAMMLVGFSFVGATLRNNRNGRLHHTT